MSDSRSNSEIRIGSERGFGFVFAVVFAIVAAWPLLGGAEPRLWALGVAAIFVSLALFTPRILRPANILWAKFGILLGKIVSPVVMALIFFVAVTPTALIMYALGKDPLRRKFDREAGSYWIPRDPAEPTTSMRNQF